MKRTWIIGCLAILTGLTACSPKAPKETATEDIPPEVAAPENAAEQANANTPNNAARPDAKTDTPQTLLDKDKADALSSRIDTKRNDLSIPGLAVGVLKDGNVIYTHCSGTTKMNDEGEAITPQTLFNVQPMVVFSSEPVKWAVTADDLKKADVQDAVALPQGNYAHPHGNMASEEITAIDPKFIEKRDSLWTNLNGMMKYLAHTTSLANLKSNDYFQEVFYSNYKLGEKLMCNEQIQSGYTVSICEIPDIKMRIVILANSSDPELEYFHSAILAAAAGPEYTDLSEKVDEFEEMMNGGSMRDMARTMPASPGNDYLLGTYHNDNFGDIRIVKENDIMVAETDSFRSRLGFHSTYDSSMEEEVNKKEAAKIKKTNPQYILVETDTGALINETIESRMILHDPPVADQTITAEVDNKAKKDIKAAAIVIKDIKFARVP